MKAVKKNIFRTLFLLTAACQYITVDAQNIRVDALPLYSKTQLRSKADWLLSGATQPSNVYKTPEGYMALSNGLITRTFTMTPNGATIGLDNLVTNEALVRAVSPEAVLWINGHEIKVGGLTGQPIGNKGLLFNPNAFSTVEQLKGYFYFDITAICKSSVKQ